MTKFDAVKKDFEQAIKRLEEILRKPKNDINRDSAIMRFILVFDLSWKTIKAYLEAIGKECSSPRGCLEEAYQEKIIKYDDLWLDLINWRNDAVHTYNEKLADRLYAYLPQALKKFKELEEVLKSFNKMKNIFLQKGSVGLVVLVIVLSVVILAGAVGGAWYYIKSQNANLKSQNDNEKLKINETETVDETTVVDGSSVEEATGTETTDATADWKTYTNEKYGFSFKYPEGWLVKLNEDYQIHLLSPTSTQINKDFNNEPGEGEIYLIIDKKNALNKMPEKYDSQKQITIANSATQQYIGVPYGQEPSASGKATIASITRNDFDIQFVCSESIYLSIFDQILSTFRFTK